MKKGITKYIILIAVTFATSIFIYNYIESSTPIDTETDIIYYQKYKEESYLGNTNFTINDPNVIVNPYDNSPLTAMVIFQTNDLTTVTVTVKGKDNSKDLTHTFAPAKVHILPIYGLYPDYENKVIISASGNSKELTIKTDKLPDDFTKVTNLEKKDFNTDEFYFTTPENTGYTAAYDDDGNVRWYLIGDYKWDIQRLNNGHILLANNKAVKENYSVGLVEMDLLGKIYYEYTVPGGYHHDAFELNNGNLLFASNNFEGNTKEDLAIIVNRSTGEIINSIDLNKIMSNKNKGNWFKMTSLYYDNGTNSITVSGYNSNMIVNIDCQTLDINWIIADKKNTPKKYRKYLLKNINEIDYPTKPQSVNLIAKDKIIFVNEKDGKRYLTTYKFDYSNKTVEQLESYMLLNDKDAYLDVLDNNNYLITQYDSIYELEDKNKVFSLKTNGILYNTKKMSLYANDMYTGVQGIRLGNLGESKSVKNSWLIGTKTDKNITKKYDISLYKDVYGLRFSGIFDKNDKVQIILDNVLDKNTYDLDIPKDGKRAYRYISETNIKGKYYIYLNINGKIYKLQKYVIFY